LDSGLRWFALEGMAALGLFSITTSGFLAGFALALGANAFHIGILAAIPFLMQILQLPAIWLVEKVRRRKALALLTWFPAQLIWFVIALIPFFVPVPGRSAIFMLLGLMAVRGLLGAVSNCNWNGWLRDLIPQTMLGQIFSRRLALATGVGILFSLAAASFVDYWRDYLGGGSEVLGYTWALVFGALFLGLASPAFMSLMPEPLMQPVPGLQPSLRQRLVAPLQDRNFRGLILFLFAWGFTSNLAIPFFAVYMLTRLGLPLSVVIAFSILSQLFNIIFLRVWGRFSDRFGNRVILSLCASLYLLVIAGWIFTTMPERYFLTIPLLVFLHIFAGIANAGVTLTVGTIGLKLAPQGEATPYLAGASLATNLGAGLGPVLGGILVGFFKIRQINLIFTWTGPSSFLEFPALSIIGFDFIFGIAFILGVITLGILTTFREEGEVSREVVLESLMTPTRELSRPLSTVPGYNLLSNFPFSYLKRIPVPGLDVALGVTVYQIAEMARAATLAAVRGRRVTKKLLQSLDSGLSRVLGDREKAKPLGIEIARQAARGALHALNGKPMDVSQLEKAAVIGVVKASSHAGIRPEDAVLGAIEGIVQGAAETKLDIGSAVKQAVEAAKRVAAQTGIPVELAVEKATQGALLAAEAIGPEALTTVKKALQHDATPPG
jgi:MFS family permease